MGDAQLPAIRCVGALIYDPHGKLLLVRRANEPGRGLWSIPGGRVESGEDDAAAVVREVAEETQLRVTVGRLCGVVERPAAAGVYVIRDYLCAPAGGTARAGSDAAELRWVAGAEFAAMDRAGELVDRLAETLAGWGAHPR